MKTKFNRYMDELNRLVMILNNFSSLNNISSKELKKYLSLISRKEFLQKKINNMLMKRTNIIGSYNDKNRAWLSSDLNCRKYCKLEQRASYKRDLSLYRTGFLNKHPSPPFFQNLKTFISERFIQPFSSKSSNLKNQLNLSWESTKSRSPIYKIIQKNKKFIKEDLPISLAQIAISSTKKYILSYRKFSDSIHLFSRSISSSTPIRTLSFIINQARQEADLSKSSFVSRIKVNPITYEYYDKNARQNGYYGTGKPIVLPAHHHPITITSKQGFVR